MITRPLFFALAAAMLLLSGASALIYQIVWARYLCLIFGGSHLAVTTVLVVFMGGLALGSYLFGTRITAKSRLFILYAGIEFGIALAALLFLGLMHYYQPIYIFLAQTNTTSITYLTVIRVALACVALIIPTTLMGGTLPVLANLLSGHGRQLGIGVSLLYAINTFGAVMGAAIAGFLLIPYFSLTIALVAALITNLTVGGLCLILNRMAETVQAEAAGEQFPAQGANGGSLTVSSSAPDFAERVVLWGVGISGFCAMGYEIFWTRILSIIAGASVYAFTLMLMAFLTGLACGSASYGELSKLCRRLTARPGGATIAFGLVQIIIGVSAYFASSHLDEMTTYMTSLGNFLQLKFNHGSSFEIRQLTTFTLITALMFVPAFFMGITFPLAVAILTERRQIPSRIIGRVLVSNTLGDIIGAATCGYFLLSFAGLQRSLQLLILINIGLGLVVIASTRTSRTALSAAIAFLLMSVGIQVQFPNLMSLWEPKIFAIYQRGDDTGSERFQTVLNNFEVLYHGEGLQALVSSIHNWGEQFFITNGRIEASNDIKDMKLQFMLGHLPMLLHKSPQRVFVLGAGTGMTLGATSVHPEVEQITLAEIEPQLMGVTRSFGIYNHQVLDNPKLRIAFNDGRNYLLTSQERFDVITADPVHPWFSGAGYLYSREYFTLAAKHLNPGGIACQWLPLYELSTDNIKSVMKTFASAFRYTMLWYAQEDAVLIGSNTPLMLDEHELERRLHEKEVHADLSLFGMGSAQELLSSFVMGDSGIRQYSRDARINSDNNLYLEFSAPRSIGKYALTAANIAGLAGFRESVSSYLTRATGTALRPEQQKQWQAWDKAARLTDRVHVLYLLEKMGEPEFEQIVTELDTDYADYAPWKFFAGTTAIEKKQPGKELAKIKFELLDQDGHTNSINLASLISREAPARASLVIMETTTQYIYGKQRLIGLQREEDARELTADIMASIDRFYRAELARAQSAGKSAPLMSSFLPKVKLLAAQKLAER